MAPAKLITVWVVERHAPAWRFRRCVVEETALVTAEASGPNPFGSVIRHLVRAITRLRGEL